LSVVQMEENISNMRLIILNGIVFRITQISRFDLETFDCMNL